MIRSSLGGQAYWDEWVNYCDGRIGDVLEKLKEPSGDSSYRPQYIFQLAQENWHQILRRYSRGEKWGQV